MGDSGSSYSMEQEEKSLFESHLQYKSHVDWRRSVCLILVFSLCLLCLSLCVCLPVCVSVCLTVCLCMIVCDCVWCARSAWRVVWCTACALCACGVCGGLEGRGGEGGGGGERRRVKNKKTFKIGFFEGEAAQKQRIRCVLFCFVGVWCVFNGVRVWVCVVCVLCELCEFVVCCVSCVLCVVCVLFSM